jgi:CPA1 family monovalent cation:H+ antiporter
MDQLLRVETLVLEMLLIVSVVAIIGRRFRFPYTVALVVVGLGLSLRPQLELDLTPRLILSLLVPPLVFEAAFHLNLNELWKNLRLVLLLAVPGVVINMLVVAGIMVVVGVLTLPIALIFGALIAASDPVSVLAIFRRIGAPKRLEVLLEGESLLNDGTAIVLFNLALTAVLVGDFRLEQGLVDFVVKAGGGVLIGVVLGWVVSRLIGVIDDYLVETTLTTVLAFGSFLLAEQIQLSGVLAVVAAGLVNGNLGRGGMSPTTRIVVFNFWEYVAFLANSAVFLLIGLRIDLPALFAAGGPILWAIVAALAGRALITVVFSLVGGPLPARWVPVLFWGGLRGGIALALALSLPAALGEDRQRVTLMTFGVVLFSLLVQGLSMHPLLRRLRIIERGDLQVEYERRHARAVASQASRNHLERLRRAGLISSHTWNTLEPMLEQRTEALARSVQEILRSAPELQKEEISTAQREALRAQRSALADLRHDGVISEETYEQVAAEVDTALDSGADAWAERLLEAGPGPDVKKIMLAMVDAREGETATSALVASGISVTLLDHGTPARSPSVLLLGLAAGQESDAAEILRRHARTQPPPSGDREADPATPSWFLLPLDGHEEITT